MRPQSILEKKLGLKGSQDHGVWIKSARTLRHLIGVLGVLLPLIIVIFSPDCIHPLESISHYYYVKSAPFLITILSLIGIFLIIYTKDFILSSVAGICALFVVFFPTTQLIDNCSIVDFPRSNNESLRIGFHYASAAVFLVILAFMCIFRFTKPDFEEVKVSKTKIKYKWIYITCGILMLLALFLVGLRTLGDIMPEAFIDFYDANKLTFWMETVAVEAFGVAWLVRGRESVKMSTITAAS